MLHSLFVKPVRATRGLEVHLCEDQFTAEGRVFQVGYWHFPLGFLPLAENNSLRLKALKLGRIIEDCRGRLTVLLLGYHAHFVFHLLFKEGHHGKMRFFCLLINFLAEDVTLIFKAIKLAQAQYVRFLLADVLFHEIESVAPRQELRFHRGKRLLVG